MLARLLLIALHWISAGAAITRRLCALTSAHSPSSSKHSLLAAARSLPRLGRKR